MSEPVVSQYEAEQRIAEQVEILPELHYWNVTREGICGTLINAPNFPDGSRLSTSVCEVNGRVIRSGSSGRRYELRDPDPAIAEQVLMEGVDTPMDLVKNRIVSQ